MRNPHFYFVLFLLATGCQQQSPRSAVVLPQTLCMLGRSAPIIVEGSIDSFRHDQPVQLATATTATAVDLNVTRLHRGSVTGKVVVYGSLKGLVDGAASPGRALLFLSNTNNTPYVMAGGQGFFWPELVQGREIWKNSQVYENGMDRAQLEAELAFGMAKAQGESCPPPPDGWTYIPNDRAQDTGQEVGADAGAQSAVDGGGTGSDAG